MAHTTLPADRVKSACEKAASRMKTKGEGDLTALLALLHLASAALSVSANSSLSVTSEEFMMLAESW